MAKRPRLPSGLSLDGNAPISALPSIKTMFLTGPQHIIYHRIYQFSIISRSITIGESCIHCYQPAYVKMSGNVG